MSIQKEQFGVTQNQEKVTKYTMKNSSGMEVSVLDLGAVITNIIVPDKNGVMEDVVLGYDTVAQYEHNGPSFGALVGRFANRIANGAFTLNGKEYKLDQNDNTNCLHGGNFRYGECMYDVECSEEATADSISFTRVSKDMEQGAPGNLTYTVTYTLNEENELMIHYFAVSDEDTILNLTNHSYFNIGAKGHQCGDIRNQDLRIMAEAYTPVDEILIPIGELRPVEGTALDFRQAHKIGERLGTPTPDEKVVDSYDHNFVLNVKEDEISKVAICSDETSGRVLEVFTDLPGIQIYTSGMLDEPNGKGGVKYGKYSGICFETQYFPNAVNEPGFPGGVIKAGEEFESDTIYRFSVNK